MVYGALRGKLRKRFVERQIETAEGVFLDLGCNRGSYVSGYDRGLALGVDISMPVLQVARKRRSSQHVHFAQGDAQNLAFIRPNSIDFILCSEMIEHVQCPERVISACHRLLRHGGKLFVTTPNYRKKKPEWVPIGEMADYGVAGVRGNLYFHTAFRPEELTAMAKRADFSNVVSGTFEKEVKYATRLPVIFFYAVSLFNRCTLRSARLDRINSRLLNEFSLIIYNICVRFGLDRALTRLVSEGVRSFLIAEK